MSAGKMNGAHQSQILLALCVAVDRAVRPRDGRIATAHLPHCEVLSVVSSTERVKGRGAVPRVAADDCALGAPADDAVDAPTLRLDVCVSVHCCARRVLPDAGLRMPHRADLRRHFLSEVFRHGDHLWRDERRGARVRPGAPSAGSRPFAGRRRAGRGTAGTAPSSRRPRGPCLEILPVCLRLAPSEAAESGSAISRRPALTPQSACTASTAIRLDPQLSRRRTALPAR